MRLEAALQLSSVIKKRGLIFRVGGRVSSLQKVVQPVSTWGGALEVGLRAAPVRGSWIVLSGAASCFLCSTCMRGPARPTRDSSPSRTVRNRLQHARTWYSDGVPTFDSAALWRATTFTLSLGTRERMFSVQDGGLCVFRCVVACQGVF